MAAFGALFTAAAQPRKSAFDPADAAAGGLGDACRAKGGEGSCSDSKDGEDDEKLPSVPPPQPVPPRRMPRTTRGLSSPSSSCSGGSVGSYGSPPGVLTALSPDAVTKPNGYYARQVPGQKGSAGEAGGLLLEAAAAAATASSAGEGDAGVPASSFVTTGASGSGLTEDPKEEPRWISLGAASSSSVGEVVGRGHRDLLHLQRRSTHLAAHNTVSAPTTTKPEVKKPEPRKEKRSKLEFSDYCCYGRTRRSTCESIMEDKPQMTFDYDVALLELRSVLRRHAIEPSDALVADLLRWQSRAGPSVANANANLFAAAAGAPS
eukprot:TRINITY_DN7671_c0_g2_i1.p1 TRINITY_DN7671_c0_g2~~TRINITY_DN7671_c0_g2_i1.p1  ORF type:complete len:320 (-),score=50.82 TRINITY_DN7671_c0_g2_i1:85-1044(-)